MKAYHQSSDREKSNRKPSAWAIVGLVFCLIMLLSGVAEGDGEMVWISLICAIMLLCVKPKPAAPAATVPAASTPKPAAPAQPSPAATVPAASTGFEAGGKHYNSAKELRWQKTEIQDKFADVYKDVHGRWVMHYSERYPCFDSSDYLYEDRYYRYNLIVADVQAGEPRWTRVCFPDAEKQPEWVSEGLQLTTVEAGLASLYHPVLRRVDLLARMAYLQAEEQQPGG